MADMQAQIFIKLELKDLGIVVTDYSQQGNRKVSSKNK